MEDENRGSWMNLFYRRGLGVFFTLTILSSQSVQGMSRILAVECPDKFLGKVKKISSSMSPFSSNLEKLAVTFTLEDSNDRVIKVVKNGAGSFKVGDVYKVELQNDLICSLQKVAQNK
jgi:hypothetical protein